MCSCYLDYVPLLLKINIDNFYIPRDCFFYLWNGNTSVLFKYHPLQNTRKEKCHILENWNCVSITHALIIMLLNMHSKDTKSYMSYFINRYSCSCWSVAIPSDGVALLLQSEPYLKHNSNTRSHYTQRMRHVNVFIYCQY